MQESDSGKYVSSERYREGMESRDEDMEGEDIEYSGYTRNVEEDRTWYSQSSASGPSTSASYARSFLPVSYLNRPPIRMSMTSGESARSYPPISYLSRRPVSMSMTTEASVIDQYPAVMNNSYNDLLTDDLADLQREEEASLFEDAASSPSPSPSPSPREATPQFSVSQTELKTALRLNRLMAAQMPESFQLPHQGNILTEDMVYPDGKPFDSMYEPTAGKQKSISRLWWGISRNGNVHVSSKDYAVYARFDHVDLYRIIYVAMVFQTTVYNADDAFLSLLAKILFLAGRPHGYENTVPGRKPPGSARCVYTAAELRVLFDVLGNKERADRDKTFIRVLKWVIERPNSSAKVLEGLPHAIIAMGEALDGYELVWECKPFGFMYELDPLSRLWYREDYVMNPIADQSQNLREISDSRLPRTVPSDTSSTRSVSSSTLSSPVSTNRSFDGAMVDPVPDQYVLQSNDEDSHQSQDELDPQPTQLPAIKKLWSGMFDWIDDDPAKGPVDPRELQICHSFDHVDLYRLIYLMRVFNCTAGTAPDDMLELFAYILAAAGRPRGYASVPQLRPTTDSGDPMYAGREIGDLFKIIAEKSKSGRGLALIRVDKWICGNPALSHAVLEDLRKIIANIPVLADLIEYQNFRPEALDLHIL